MISVQDIVFTRYPVQDLDPAAQFMRHFGLLPSARTDKALYLRGYGANRHTYVAELGPENCSIGFALAAKSAVDLDRLSEETGAPVQLVNGPAGGQLAAISKVVGDQIVDLFRFAEGDASMWRFLTELPSRKAQIEAASAPAYPLSSVHIEAPINDPQKFLAIGMNYQTHADEAASAGIAIPEAQLWFNKQASCIAGPTDKVVLPTSDTTADEVPNPPWPAAAPFRQQQTRSRAA